MAWVRLKDQADAADFDLAGLRAFCTERIAHYKIPRYLRLTSDFPMTVTGKVRKVEMREVSIAELGLHADAAVRNA